MPRIARVAVGDTIYHVINRANGRISIFHTDEDLDAYYLGVQEPLERRWELLEQMITLVFDQS